MGGEGTGTNQIQTQLTTRNNKNEIETKETVQNNESNSRVFEKVNKTDSPPPNSPKKRKGGATINGLTL